MMLAAQFNLFSRECRCNQFSSPTAKLMFSTNVARVFAYRTKIINLEIPDNESVQWRRLLRVSWTVHVLEFARKEIHGPCQFLVPRIFDLFNGRLFLPKKRPRITRCSSNFDRNGLRSEFMFCVECSIALPGGRAESLLLFNLTPAQPSFDIKDL
jgi:hypothetical protein